jgi:hypothetical protein
VILLLKRRRLYIAKGNSCTFEYYNPDCNKVFGNEVAVNNNCHKCLLDARVSYKFGTLTMKSEI